MFIEAETGDYPLSEYQIKARFPQTSFPREFTPPPGYAKVAPTPFPSYDPMREAYREMPPALVDGVWTQVWEVYALPPEKIAANEEADWQNRAAAVRAERARLLQESDWVVIMHTERGTNIPLEWEVYRQALRAITSQEGFPYNVAWPAKPE
jgi:hypothetical protein